MWLVSEFCNRGPLLTAIERGAFLTQPSSHYGQPNLISVLQVGGGKWGGRWGGGEERSRGRREEGGRGWADVKRRG